MRLAVRHVTHFEYDSVLDYSVHLTPLSFASQKVVQWAITTPGIENALSYIDGFGNIVYLVTCSNIKGPVEVIAEGLVDCENAGGLVNGVVCTAPNSVFLRQTDATKPSLQIQDHVQAPLSGSKGLAQLHALMAAIHHQVAFTIGATDASTTAAEAYLRGRGVCQDHTHIFLGVARALGIPSRYVTGYLVTGIGASSSASHAWAEAFVPDLGWVGFDAANGICPTDHYVRVAAGIDAAAVTPIRGSRRGGAHETMTVEVRVEINQQ
jgi:transglutaminase-like putative cysteine protease